MPFALHFPAHPFIYENSNSPDLFQGSWEPLPTGCGVHLELHFPNCSKIFTEWPQNKGPLCLAIWHAMTTVDKRSYCRKRVSCDASWVGGLDRWWARGRALLAKALRYAHNRLAQDSEKGVGWRLESRNAERTWGAAGCLICHKVLELSLSGEDSLENHRTVRLH